MTARRLLPRRRTTTPAPGHPPARASAHLATPYLTGTHTPHPEPQPARRAARRAAASSRPPLDTPPTDTEITDFLAALHPRTAR